MPGVILQPRLTGLNHFGFSTRLIGPQEANFLCERVEMGQEDEFLTA